MRILLLSMLLAALALSGCARQKVADSGSRPQPKAGSRTVPTGTTGSYQPLTVTPDNTLVGKVVGVNTPGRFVVLSFPLGRMPSPERRLNLYRRGQMVGEVKVTGPQREDNTVADLLAGEAEVGDDARGQ
jgi:hypothetical protein